MKEEQKEKAIAILCVLSGISCYLMVCLHWIAGLLAAILSIALGIYHGNQYQWNRMTKIGTALGAAFLAFGALVLLSIRIYYAMIHL